jgi:hypothetical protein
MATVAGSTYDSNSSNAIAKMDDKWPHGLLADIIHIFIQQSQTRAGKRYDAVQELAGEMVEIIERHLRCDDDEVSLVIFTFRVYHDLNKQGYGMAKDLRDGMNFKWETVTNGLFTCLASEENSLQEGPNPTAPFLDRRAMKTTMDTAPTPLGKLLAFDAETRKQAVLHKGKSQAPEIESQLLGKTKAPQETTPSPVELVSETTLPTQEAQQDIAASISLHHPSVGAYYQDLRTITTGRDLTKQNLAIQLRTMTPRPLGIVFPSQGSDPDQGWKLLRNAAAYDRFIIMLRTTVSVGLKVERSKDARIYDLALHNFGADKLADYIIKGALVEMLYPEAKRDIRVADVPFETLIQHPIIKKALWGHPSIQLYPNATWMCQAGKHEWGFEYLSDEMLANMAIHHWDGISTLSEHMDRLFKPRKFKGADVKFTSRMPLLIPVLLDRNPVAKNKKFDYYRSFTLTAPVYPRLIPGEEVDVELRSRQYHISMVINLHLSLMHLYNRKTEPVYQKPDLDEELKNERLNNKHTIWSVTDENTSKYLLFYRKVLQKKGEQYSPPVKGLPEFLISKPKKESCEGGFYLPGEAEKMST